MQFNVDIASLGEVGIPPPVFDAWDFPVRERSARTAWAVVLAGGDGVRLRPLSRLIAGDDRPKQFCRIFGDRTLLAQTRSRLAPVVEDDHTLFVVTKSHEPYYREELKGVHSSRLIAQPKNKGTGAAIAAAVLRIAARDPNAVIAFIPSDHFYRSERHFQSSLTAALATAAEWQESIVLLGAQATCAETDYGWIEPGATAAGDFSGNLHRVWRFWEKPSAEVAERLHSRACLWNTFVMTGHANAFLRMLEACVPGLVGTLMAAQRQGRLEDAYLSEALESVDFSSQVLARSTEQLFVVRMPSSAGWSDLGVPERVMSALADAGLESRQRTLREGVVAAMA
ncbi:MAG TPA: sugar phosphate nucleotidyltransferase [Bryobacteraceae bacterium]|nr:sugar phosphate nucleotidyltransferase [Bryobacteraceae bacterium]